MAASWLLHGCHMAGKSAFQKISTIHKLCKQIVVSEKSTQKDRTEKPILVFCLRSILKVKLLKITERGKSAQQF
jgi:hypothetical protein